MLERRPEKSGRLPIARAASTKSILILETRPLEEGTGQPFPIGPKTVMSLATSGEWLLKWKQQHLEAVRVNTTSPTKRKPSSEVVPHDTHLVHGGYNTLRAAVLTKISVPHSEPYRFETATGGAGSCSQVDGRVEEITLPTLGKIAYQYRQNWFVPTRCTYSSDPTAEFHFPVTAVRRRTEKNRSGATQGVTAYQSELFPRTASLVRSGVNCTRLPIIEKLSSTVR